MKHTLLPWAAGGNVIHAIGFVVAECHEDKNHGINAAFIAAACNNFELLLGAAKKAWKDLVNTDGADWQIAQLTLDEALHNIEHDASFLEYLVKHREDNMKLTETIRWGITR